LDVEFTPGFVVAVLNVLPHQGDRQIGIYRLYDGHLVRRSCLDGLEVRRTVRSLLPLAQALGRVGMGLQLSCLANRLCDSRWPGDSSPPVSMLRMPSLASSNAETDIWFKTPWQFAVVAIDCSQRIDNLKGLPA
jgi:hypothetical protein